jgi:hypothetical protein
MARVEGCWANVLDDCDGPLTGEHIVSVAVWSPVPGMPNNRKGKLPRVVTVGGGPGLLTPGPTTVRHLTSDILCERHNNTTNDLDEVGGRFARAVEELDRVDQARRWAPNLNWAWHTIEVDGPRLQRWFLKTIINNAVGQALPIGAGAAPGRPTRELVEMVYGRRPIAFPQGLFCVARVGNQHSFGEGFQTIFIDQNRQHLVGALLVFRTLVFGFNFETSRMPPELFDKQAELRGSSIIQPFNELNFDRTNVALRLRW